MVLSQIGLAALHWVGRHGLPIQRIYDPFVNVMKNSHGVMKNSRVGRTLKRAFNASQDGTMLSPR
ncbi:hypothetical protein GCM10022212_26860 [Actimicrobium antarcticum]|uniref:Uncharacterized protein n=1 Tax=Actimicrobium antarcticum TaxID=1051899 RepID=A0ABP7TJU5_9BURK